MDSSKKPSTASTAATNSSSIPSTTLSQTAAMSYGYIYYGYPQPFYSSPMMPTSISTNQQPIPPPPSYQIPSLQIPPPPPQILPPSISPSTLSLQTPMNAYNQMINPYQSLMPYHSIPTTPTPQYPIEYVPNYIPSSPNVGHVASIQSKEQPHNSSPTIFSKSIYSTKTSNKSSLSDLHSQKIPQTQPKTFSCQICNKTFSEKFSFRKHISGHKNNKKPIEKLNTINNETKDHIIDEQKKLNISKIPGKTQFANSVQCEVQGQVQCNSLDAYLSQMNGQEHNKVTGSKQLQLDSKTMSELEIPEIQSDDVPPSFKRKIFHSVKTNKPLSYKIPKFSTIETQQSSLVGSNLPKPAFLAAKIVASTPKYSQDIDNNDAKKHKSNDGDKKNRFAKFSYGDVHAINVDDKEEDIIGDKSIGQDFVEEVLDQKGNIVCYTCTLCEVRFNDLNGKNLHLKGKRHRVQYKKKVDPNLLVEYIKSDKKKIEKEKMIKEQIIKEKTALDLTRFSQDIDPFTSEQDSEESSYSLSSYKPVPIPNHLKSFCDVLMETRHSEISPSEKELEYIHKTAQLIEDSIYSVGKFIETNFLIKIPDPKIEKVEKSIMNITTIDNLLQNNSDNLVKNDQTKEQTRFIRVLRTGPMGQGILLHNERKFELIINASILPTKCLLIMFERFIKNEIVKLSQDRSKYEKDYSVKSSTVEIKECKFELILNNNSDDDLSFDIHLTSPYIKNEKSEILHKEVEDLLDIDKCLESLRKIRQHRWFKKQTKNFPNFNFVLRLFRDVSQRREYLSTLSLWCFQVLTERTMCKNGPSFSPSSVFRYIFENLCSGLLNHFGPGLADPCESVGTDLFGYLKPQEREDLFFAATVSLRLMCFRQMHTLMDLTEEESEELRAKY